MINQAPLFFPITPQDRAVGAYRWGETELRDTENVQPSSKMGNGFFQLLTSNALNFKE